MKGKAKAKNLQRKYPDAPDEKGSNDAPPTPPPTTDDLIRNIGSLSISPAKTFVGGFHPAYAADQQAYYYGLGNYYGLGTTSGSNPTSYSAGVWNDADRPISMPIPCVAPQSLTVQHALRPLPSSISAGRLHSDTLSAPPVWPSISATLSTHPPKKSASAPSTPVKNAKLASTLSAPVKNTRSPSPGGSPGGEKCAGITKANTRCSRNGKLSPALSMFNGAIALYCYQHIKDVLIPTAFYSRKDGLTDTRVPFEDWIPAYLQPATQAALRTEMDKRASVADENGYIYTIEIRDPSKKKETIKLKVGRSICLPKRVEEWSKQCGSKEHALRGFYPDTAKSDDENEGSLMKGRVKGGEKGPWCHRLERLIHLELADLACHRVYLKPEWPDIATPPAPLDAVKRAACPDCGVKHKEIFEFERWQKGEHEGKEWEVLVQPVIQRWGKFVELYVTPA